ncbi:MAG TPA: hypothetical protein VLX28_21770 [Thermoanaerobaculia bacterium]|nr:hypothetical protein [Thermoanaerobaculia bacterium]
MSEPTAAGMTAPAAGVKVRMFRQGLGDCFLLAFPTRGPRPCYVLIDCGVELGTGDAAETMKQVAAGLYEATGGTIDVLVAALQHWDHVSGFLQAREAFDRIEIGQVWAAWTEDPNDAAAQRLRARRATAVRALHAAAQELRQCGEEESAGSLESVLEYYGDLGKDGRPSAVPQTLAYVLGRGHPPRYLRHGDQPELPGVDGARVRVLGPPGAAPLRPLAPAPGPGEMKPKTLSFPFDPSFRVAVDEARRDPFFQASYFGVAGQPNEHEMAWRQIETEWLTSASQLAPQLDGSTNNTSLALAVELVPSGKVILFAADTQAGSWPQEESSAGGAIPLAPLLQSLLKKSMGRGPGAHPEVPEEWKDFEKRCTFTPDYVELAIAEPAPRPRREKKA